MTASHMPDPSRRESWTDPPAHATILAQNNRLVADAAERVRTDRYHPRYHFTPASRFMNDPNGLVCIGDAYHLFYQHLPNWGEPEARLAPSWGHAVSPDLVHWRRLPIALSPVPGTYDAEAIASGACVLSDGMPTIVYTSVAPQAQSLARSFDGGRTWFRYAGNPVLHRPDLDGLLDGFRDPTVWREHGRWRMLVGCGMRDRGGAVLLYTSPDLVRWSLDGPLCVGMGPDCFQWECPAFFPLGDRWVLIVSPLLHSEPALRGPVQYAVGRYDGRRFEPGAWRMMDLGGPGVYYAPNTLQDRRGRRILWGWVMGGGEPGRPWNGLLTVPRVLTLSRDGLLEQRPAPEVDSLRLQSLSDIRRSVLTPDAPIDSPWEAQTDGICTFRAEPGAALHVDLQAGEWSHRVTYASSAGHLASGTRTGRLDGEPAGRSQLRLLWDRSVLELYADRRGVLTDRVYPPDTPVRVRIACSGGRLLSLRWRAWSMGSGCIDESPGSSPAP